MAKEYVYWFTDNGLQSRVFEAKNTSLATAGKTKSLVNNLPHILLIYCYSDAINEWFVQNINGAKVVHISDVPKAIRALHLIST